MERLPPLTMLPSGGRNSMRVVRIRFIGTPPIAFRIAPPRKFTYLNWCGTRAAPLVYGAVAVASGWFITRHPGKPVKGDRLLIPAPLINTNDIFRRGRLRLPGMVLLLFKRRASFFS